MLGCSLAFSMGFALLHVLAGGAIPNARPGCFGDAFFFSIEIAATGGYGVMAPARLHGHAISSVEIVAGMAFTAIVAGLLFVRLSRLAVTIGGPTLMLGLAHESRLSSLDPEGDVRPDA
jgi:inward rectifier potassium channel